MKVALVHDWLNTKFGGAENVLLDLAETFPQAPIYTLLYNPQVVDEEFEKGRVRPSLLRKAPKFIQKRSRYLLPLIPMAIEQMDLSDYDVVISSSSAFAKGVITRPETLHICYCHTPMRFVWDYWPKYVSEQGVGALQRAAIHILTSRLRLWDYYSSARVDRWLANSQTTAKRIKKYYHQSDVTIIHPGANLDDFSPEPADEKGDYLVTLGSLTPYKKIDMAIAACNRLGRRLIVIGDGADRGRLESLAGPTIEFVGRVSDSHRAELVARARALVFPNEEDFGIAPIEAMASGTPVIAYGKGGLTETVIEGKTGVFFDEPTVESLATAIREFDPAGYKTSDLTGRAAGFSNRRFKGEIRNYVETEYGEFKRQ